MNPVPMRPQKKRYERLSPQDASFLVFEKPDLHMHVGLVAFFEVGSFRLESGAIDLAKLRRVIASRLAPLPRCRQKLAYIPVTRQPVWVDDASFRIEDHVRDVTLGGSGGDDDLRLLAGELFSVPLDRAKPLWEIWLVQGYNDPGLFAMVCKVHHAIIDGIAAIDFIGALLRQEPDKAITDAPLQKLRPAPHRARLLVDDALRWAVALSALALAARRFAMSGPTRAAFRERAGALVVLLARGIRGTSPSPLRGHASARRWYGWMATACGDERAVRSRLGGSRDDVTVATAAGAARAFLLRHGADPQRLRIRAMMPMSRRARAERGHLGNRVSMLVVDLPVAEADPALRLQRVSEHVAALKEAKQPLGVDVLTQIDRWTGTLAQSLSMWIATRFHSYSLMVTNVPGPPAPLYMLDAKLLAMYPLAPIFGGHHTSIAALSYLGKVHWGVQYGGDDPDEAKRIVEDLRDSFDALVTAAAEAPPPLRMVGPVAAGAGSQPKIAASA